MAHALPSRTSGIIPSVLDVDAKLAAKDVVDGA